MSGLGIDFGDAGAEVPRRELDPKSEAFVPAAVARRRAHLVGGTGGRASEPVPRLACAPLRENTVLPNAGMPPAPRSVSAGMRHPLPPKPPVSPHDVQMAGVTLRADTPSDAGSPVVGAAAPAAPAPSRAARAPATPVLHPLPAKPATPVLPAEKDDRVAVDVALEGRSAVEGGCLQGCMRLTLPDHTSPATAMLLAQPRVRLIGYEALPEDDVRHVFYHRTCVIDGDRSVDGPSEPYVLHGSPELSQPEDAAHALLPCYASRPDDAGFHLGRGGTYDLPFSLSLPIGRGARGCYRSERAQVGYMVIASVRVKAFGETHGGVAHCFQNVELHPYLNPTAALASSARPLLASTTSGTPPAVQLAAALHRENWVAGQSVYVDVHVQNHTQHTLGALRVALVCRETLTRDQATPPTCTQRVVAHEALHAGKPHGWWSGVRPCAAASFSHAFCLPADALTLVRGRHVDVQYVLRVCVADERGSASAEVELPLRIVHYVSLDPPPSKRNLAQSAGLFPSTLDAHEDPRQMIERVRSLEALRSPRSTLGASSGMYLAPCSAAAAPVEQGGRTAQHRRSLDFINNAIRSATARRYSPHTEPATTGLGIEVDAGAEEPAPTEARPNRAVPAIVTPEPEAPPQEEPDESVVLGDETNDDVGLALGRAQGDESAVSCTDVLDAYHNAAANTAGAADLSTERNSTASTPVAAQGETRVSSAATPHARTPSTPERQTTAAAPVLRARASCSVLSASVPSTPMREGTERAGAPTASAPRPGTARKVPGQFTFATSTSPLKVKAKPSIGALDARAGGHGSPVRAARTSPAVAPERAVRRSQSTATLRGSEQRPLGAPGTPERPAPSARVVPATDRGPRMVRRGVRRAPSRR